MKRVCFPNVECYVAFITSGKRHFDTLMLSGYFSTWPKTFQYACWTSCHCSLTTKNSVVCCFLQELSYFLIGKGKGLPMITSPAGMEVC